MGCSIYLLSVQWCGNDTGAPCCHHALHCLLRNVPIACTHKRNHSPPPSRLLAAAAAQDPATLASHRSLLAALKGLSALGRMLPEVFERSADELTDFVLNDLLDADMSRCGRVLRQAACIAWSIGVAGSDWRVLGGRGVCPSRQAVLGA